MTLLHQAAQKAVEAPAVHAAVREAGGIVHSDGNIFFTNAAKFMQAIAALQQQPEPVAKPSRVGEDGWRKLAESQAALLELANLAEDSAAELAAEIGANLPLERAIAGIDYFLTVKEDRRFIEGARADLMKLSEPPALQHQEEPREPVAVWQSQCKDGTWADCTEANARAGERYGFAARALYASPSTTRQQEVGSGWRPIESAPKDGSEMLLSNGQIVAQGWWEHQEPYIREHRDMDGRYIDQDEHDGYDGWLDFAGGMLPEPTHWMPLPAAPSTPEKAGGVSDGVDAPLEGQQ